MFSNPLQINIQDDTVTWGIFTSPAAPVRVIEYEPVADSKSRINSGHLCYNASVCKYCNLVQMNTVLEEVAFFSGSVYKKVSSENKTLTKTGRGTVVPW